MQASWFPSAVLASMSLAVGCWASGAMAHPHVFIDTGIEVIVDGQNRVTGLRITWSYDDYYSLFVIADKALDPDWDGALTATEKAALSGFDMHWEPGFAGDTYALLDDTELALSAPKDWTVDYRDNRITSTHLRTFDMPVAPGGQPLIVQVYDPSYYNAYSITIDPVVTGGTDCDVKAYAPDVSVADEALKAALSEYSASEDVEQDFPAIGKVYSEEIQVTCPAL
jgi:ABC-type uncharacterized transport system substrate-binding protein